MLRRPKLMKLSAFYAAVLILTFHSPEAFSQSTSSPLQNQQMTNAAGVAYSPSDNVMRTFDNRDRSTEGSPYLLNSWMDGLVVSTNGSIFQDLMIRYNIEEDEITMASNDGSTIKLPRKDIAEFEIRDRYDAYHFIAIEDPKEPEAPQLFCQLLEDGPVQVLVHRRKYFVPSSSMVAFGNQERPEYKFYPDRYYLRKRETGETFKVGRWNGKAFRFLGEYEDQIRQYAREHEFFVTDPEQLLLIIRRYNTMIYTTSP